ncbi:hypothetical protein AVEN_11294-1 [Araneus ventricosus]|uniref:Uncharacterized protein n=1 Tax=Araneus ventricosus TaxID=182803 RepID=A0A4Y2DYQ4_ARAVE|nr:hypothetical protein AVEN_11294-1 [Araneus ventricosus]
MTLFGSRDTWQSDKGRGAVGGNFNWCVRVSIVSVFLSVGRVKSSVFHFPDIGSVNFLCGLGRVAQGPVKSTLPRRSGVSKKGSYKDGLHRGSRRARISHWNPFSI